MATIDPYINPEIKGFDPKELFSKAWLPPATEHLGTSLIECDVDKGWVRLSFEPKPEFVNPHGGIQGGFISAMLDECFSFAAFIHMKGAFRTPTIEMTTQFINHAKVETLSGEGRLSLIHI